ncbi:MAG: hypothetical protein HUK14_10640 [Muribaculaceae bacterium]|nr:hypothetical protein [Muribaculaceae bacterium]
MKNLLKISAVALSLTLTASAAFALGRTIHRTWGAPAVASEKPAAVRHAAAQPRLAAATATIPYLNTFDTEAEQLEVRVIDNNKDNCTFTFNQQFDGYGYSAHYTYNAKNKADDYVVFPAMELKAGTIYSLTFETRVLNPNITERVELLAGTGNKAADLTITVIPPTEVNSKSWTVLKCENFKVETAGTYYFAIHAVSDPDKFALLCDNFSVAEIDAEAPGTVTGLSVKADATGLNKATVSFTVPTKTASGATLTGEVMVKLTRSGELVMNEKKAPGEDVIFEDNVPAPGMYTYSAVVSQGSKQGDETFLKAYVGVVIPSNVTNCQAVDAVDKVDVSWDAPTTGVEGGVIIPEDLTYNLYPTSVSATGIIMVDYEHPYVKGVKGTKCTIEMPTSVGEQCYKYIAITAQNDAGESEDREAYVLVGAPYTTPFVESSAGGTITYWWGIDMTDEMRQAGSTAGDGLEDDSYDDDGGCMMMQAKIPGWIAILSGKISLAGTTNPELITHIKSSVASKVEVSVMTAGGIEPLETFDIAKDYAEYKLDLSRFVGEDWVRIVIMGIFTKATLLNIDKTIVGEIAGNDLGVSLEAPETLTLGKSSQAKVTVRNLGQQPVTGWTGKVYAADNVIAEFEASAKDVLEMYDSKTYTVDFRSDILDEVKPIVLKAVVDYTDDNPDNNTASATVEILTPDVNPVDKVDAGFTADGAVISWSIVEQAPIPVEESFEDYADQAVTDGKTVGQWTAYDVDKLDTYTLDGSSWHPAVPYAFGIWTPENHIPSYMEYDITQFVRTGKKSVIFPDAVPAGDLRGNDDWMVSPLLPGKAQTVKFYVSTTDAQYYGLEKFEVCYSATSTQPEAMTKLYESTVEPGMWTEVEVDLPEGALYFAIHFVSRDAFFMCVDDVTFTANANPTGYRIYVDGVMAGEAASTARDFRYVGELDDSKHTVAVTALYGEKESAPVSHTFDRAAIVTISADASDAPAPIYNLLGVKVSDGPTAPLPPGLYIQKGSKLLIK